MSWENRNGVAGADAEQQLDSKAAVIIVQMNEIASFLWKRMAHNVAFQNEKCSKYHGVLVWKNCLTAAQQDLSSSACVFLAVR